MSRLKILNDTTHLALVVRVVLVAGIVFFSYLPEILAATIEQVPQVEPAPQKDIGVNQGSLSGAQNSRDINLRIFSPIAQTFQLAHTIQVTIQGTRGIYTTDGENCTFRETALGTPRSVTCPNAVLIAHGRSEGGGTSSSPEPGTILLLGSGLVGLVGWRLKQQIRKAAS